jgi:hypothetical protein
VEGVTRPAQHGAPMVPGADARVSTTLGSIEDFSQS